MDFLDPKAKKRHNTRLMIGYVLMGILIITSSLILVFQAYGFDVDRKTGQVIQNGLVYIDSAPDGADLYLNGELYKDKTNARLTLPQGKYDILIKKTGYRDWRRTVEVKGGSVERITYPLLIVTQLQSTEIAAYDNTEPLLSTQSPDRRWLLVAKDKARLSYTEYDLNNLDQAKVHPEESTISFDSKLFKPADGPESLKVVEWSTDNKNFLVDHTYGTGHEFIILNREKPAASYNINTLLGVNPDKITLRDKKPDQWYLYTAKDGLLQTANTQREINEVVRNVTSYKTHDSSVILYSMKISSKQDAIMIRQNNNTYNLRTVNSGAVKLDIARYDSDWFVAVGSDGDKKTYVYKNPVDVLSKGDGQKPAPQTIFKATGTINGVSFSSNTRFIMAQDGQNMGVYDNEKDDSYAYKIKQILDQGSEVRWMDGHRVLFESGGIEMITDFDGSNTQKLTTSGGGRSAFFDRDYTVLYTLDKSKAQPTKTALFSSPLRLVTDR